MYGCHRCWCCQRATSSIAGLQTRAIDWFSKCLGYTFWPGQQGAESDWLMDLVSVGFSKPKSLIGASMTSRSDVVKASELWQAHAQKVRALGQRVYACTTTTEIGRPQHMCSTALRVQNVMTMPARRSTLHSSIFSVTPVPHAAHSHVGKFLRTRLGKLRQWSRLQEN